MPMRVHRDSSEDCSLVAELTDGAGNLSVSPSSTLAVPVTRDSIASYLEAHDSLPSGDAAAASSPKASPKSSPKSAAAGKDKKKADEAARPLPDPFVEKKDGLDRVARRRAAAKRPKLNRTLVEIVDIEILEEEEDGVTDVIMAAMRGDAEPASFVQYKLKVLSPDSTWFVLKRYTDFEMLHKEIKKRLVDRSLLPSLPGKLLFGNFDDARIQQRKFDLTTYINRLLQIVETQSYNDPGVTPMVVPVLHFIWRNLDGVEETS